MFDLDNTLINFMRMKRKSCDAAISEMVNSGLKANKRDAMRILYELYDKYGMEDQTIFQKLLRKINHKIDYKILARGIDAYRKAQFAYMKPYPGVVSTLLELKKRNIKIGIVSDAPKLRAHIRLVELSLEDFFDTIVAFEDTGVYKPSPEPYKRALNILRVKPEDSMMVGDMPERDIKGAKALGMKTVHAKYGNVSKSKIKADFSINRIEDLITILD